MSTSLRKFVTSSFVSTTASSPDVAPATNRTLRRPWTPAQSVQTLAEEQENSHEHCDGRGRPQVGEVRSFTNLFDCGSFARSCGFLRSPIPVLEWQRRVLFMATSSLLCRCASQSSVLSRWFT